MPGAGAGRCGVRDPQVDRCSIAATLPTTELTVCPGAGHMLMMERPDQVNSAVAGVVDRVLAGRPATRL